MTELAIGLGVGLGGTVTVAILGYILNRGLLSRANTDSDERRFAVQALSRSVTDVTSLKDVIVQHEKNADALRRELGDLATTNRSLAAKCAAVETTNHDLLAALEASNATGALPLALRAELDRLRSFVSASGEAAPGAAAGGEAGGEAGAVHGAPEVHAPR